MARLESMSRVNPALLAALAQSMQQQAKAAPTLYAVLGAVAGLLVGPALMPSQPTLLGGLLLGSVGFAAGRRRAMTLTLQAQLAFAARESANPEWGCGALEQRENSDGQSTAV